MTKLTEVKRKIKEKPQLVLIIFGVAFFFIYSWLYLSTPAIYNSPDETATAIFTNTYLESSSFQIPFSPNPTNTIHPRSVNIAGSSFVPGGFIGLPLLLAIIGKLFGSFFLLTFPALLAVIAIICSYRIFSAVFSKQIAFYSSILFFFLPQWWHFVSKGFLPNTVFLSLLLIAITCFFIAHDQNRAKYQSHLFSFLSGITLLTALVIRPNEFVWVSGCILLLLIVYRKKVEIPFIISLFIGGLIPLVLVLTIQSQTYGGVFVTGYDQLEAVDQISFLSKLIANIFPFGVDLIQSAKTLFLFVFQLFWWQIILIALGFVSFVKRPLKSNEQKIYTAIFLLVSLYLFLYYGAWIIADDLDVTRVSIGISYIRYWLPFSVLSIPFMVMGLEYLAEKAKPKKVVFSVLFISLLIGQTIFVYQGKDGLRKIQQTVVNYKDIQDGILLSTEQNAIIVGERIDKIIWPKRQVIHFEDQDYSFVSNLPLVLEHYPVYWLTLLPYDHVLIWEQTEFAPIGLELETIDFSQSGYSLYKIHYAN